MDQGSLIDARQAVHIIIISLLPAGFPSISTRRREPFVVIVCLNACSFVCREISLAEQDGRMQCLLRLLRGIPAEPRVVVGTPYSM